MSVHNPAKEKPDQEQPHYHGHRVRLRQKFIQNGPDPLADYELLELILFAAIPRRDVKPLAKELIAAFGSLSGLLNASISEIEKVPGVSDNTAVLLKTVQALGQRMMKQEIMQKPVLSSWSRLIEYCQATMAHEKKEHFRVLFLNKKNVLIADEIQQSGTVDHTPAYPREIIKRALEHGATALILVHNHPSGDPTPSRSDIDMTHAIKATAQPFGIVIHDHLVVSGNGTSSFKTLGLL